MTEQIDTTQNNSNDDSVEMAKSFWADELKQEHRVQEENRQRALSFSQAAKSSTGAAHHNLASSTTSSATKRILIMAEESSQDDDEEEDAVAMKERKVQKDRENKRFFVGYFNYYWEKFGFFKALCRFWGSILWNGVYTRTVGAIGFSIGFFISARTLVPHWGLQNFLVQVKS